MNLEYRQCLLVKTEKDSTSSLVTWIPNKFAILGKILKLREDDSWDDGWVVNEIFDSVNEKDLIDPHKIRKVHRSRTGDSLCR